jgi:hypothetical protein
MFNLKIDTNFTIPLDIENRGNYVIILNNS